MGRLLASVLPLLAVLACPVLMLLCLRAMRGHGSHQPPTASAHGLPDSTPGSTTERISVLERELAALRTDRDQPGHPPPSAGPAASFPAQARASAEPTER
jgi:hypothetical protein